VTRVAVALRKTNERTVKTGRTLKRGQFLVFPRCSAARVARFLARAAPFQEMPSRD
jgi:hypothetical protein